VLLHLSDVDGSQKNILSNVILSEMLNKSQCPRIVQVSGLSYLIDGGSNVAIFPSISSNQSLGPVLSDLKILIAMARFVASSTSF